MKTTFTDLQASIYRFSTEFSEKYQAKLNHMPLVEVDEDWPSPCVQGTHDEDYQYWLPFQVEEALTFDNLESALNLKLHQSIKEYFTGVFSESVPATCSEGHLQLLFAWSVDDFSRLQQNLIGHIMMKQKLKQEVTLFFAVTDDEDIMLTVNNENGEVWAEKVGCKPHKKIADSLADFINGLQPDIYLPES